MYEKIGKLYMKAIKRWVLLRHLVDSGETNNNHFDLLIEDGMSCRAWRLDSIPEIDGSAVLVTVLPPHRRIWLETSGQKVSGGRGWAEPVNGGVYLGNLPEDAGSTIELQLKTQAEIVKVQIDGKSCKFLSV